MNREQLVRHARVMIRECRARRSDRRFAAWLLNSAIRATSEALRLGGQRDLFA